jgi:hypothetical protein
MKFAVKRTWLWVGVALLALGFVYLPALGIGVGQIFVFLLLLLCPLMHFLMGHRPGAHGSGGAEGNGASAPGKREIEASDREK